MPITAALVVLAVIALVLHLLFNYLIPVPISQPARAIIAACVIVVIFVLWHFTALLR